MWFWRPCNSPNPAAGFVGERSSVAMSRSIQSDGLRRHHARGLRKNTREIDWSPRDVDRLPISADIVVPPLRVRTLQKEPAEAASWIRRDLTEA
jgi:hypothetical protein